MKLRAPLFVLLGLVSSCGDDSSLNGVKAESVQLAPAGGTGKGTDCLTTTDKAGAKGPGEDSSSAPLPDGQSTSTAPTDSSSGSSTGNLGNNGGTKLIARHESCIGRPNGSICNDYAVCVHERCMPSVCGDGIIDTLAYEECEDGNNEDHDGCDACIIERCGDGILHKGEECDDGNNIREDNCSNDCKRTPKNLCGNGKLDPKEQCDDANTINDDACSNDCRLAPGPACGNGKVDNGETCDDGNNRNHDGCSANCQKEFCGDGVISFTREQCDDGNQENGDGCSSKCQVEFATCGNGVVEDGEDCDDGNNRNSDTCPNDCLNAVCGDGIREGLESCDDGNTEAGDGCSEVCAQETRCGNRIVEFAAAGEHCDDGGPDPDNPESNFDLCPDNCKMPRCGDKVWSGMWEECEGTDTPHPGQECDAECKIIPVCGNGVKEDSVAYPKLSEVCDDGNTEDGDGCSADCKSKGNQLLSCVADGVVDVAQGEECDPKNWEFPVPGRSIPACIGCRWTFFNKECSECMTKRQIPLSTLDNYCYPGTESGPGCLEVISCYFEEECVTFEVTDKVKNPQGALSCVIGSYTDVTFGDPANEPDSPCFDVIAKYSYMVNDASKTPLALSDRRGFMRGSANPQFVFGKAGQTVNRMAQGCRKECRSLLRPSEVASSE